MTRSTCPSQTSDGGSCLGQICAHLDFRQVENAPNATARTARRVGRLAALPTSSTPGLARRHMRCLNLASNEGHGPRHGNSHDHRIVWYRRNERLCTHSWVLDL